VTQQCASDILDTGPARLVAIFGANQNLPTSACLN
jgi:hypothetical protein